MKKKIFFIFLFSLAAIAAAYFGFFARKGNKADFTNLKVPDMRINLGGLDIGNLALDALNIGVSLPKDLFPNIKTGLDVSNVGNINLPLVSFDLPSFGGQPAESSANEAVCDQFKTAPSCSYVPAQYQDLCQQCKEAQ